MIRAVLVVAVALFSLAFAPVSHAGSDGEGDTVVWGT